MSTMSSRTSTVSLLTLLVLFVSHSIRGQEAITLVESTIKVGGISEEVFYYGFAAGDRMLFDFEEVNGKELKELEIIELPASSKFMDYKTKRIEGKAFLIPRTGIYKFRFSNSAIGGRVCRIRIQRTPDTEQTRNFDPTVYWRTVYDTIRTPRQERFLEKSDTIVTSLIDQVAKVSSTSALNGNPNRSIVDFTLPAGTVSWSYYIGVGHEGKAAYDAAKDKFFTSAASSVSEISGYGPMAALALTGLNVFSKALGGDNVKYYFISDWDNVQLFLRGQAFLQYKLGDVVNDASPMRSPLIGKVYLGLVNDNVMDAIDVVIKATAIQLQQTWGLRTVIDTRIDSRQEAFLKD